MTGDIRVHVIKNDSILYRPSRPLPMHILDKYVWSLSCMTCLHELIACLKARTIVFTFIGGRGRGVNMYLCVWFGVGAGRWEW